MSLNDKMDKLSEFAAKLDTSSKARTRLTALFDADSFVELDSFLMAGENAAGVVAGYGMIEGGIVYAWSQDVSVDSGAVSHSHIKKIKKVYELAAKTGCPVVSVFDSKGAKLSEGAAMLNAYSKMLMWTNNLSGVVPQIALVLGTCAGVSAMVAASADYVLMSKEAELFLTAPFISKAAGDTAKGAGTADNAAKGGVAAIVCEDEAATIEKAKKLITMLPQNNLSSLPLFDFTDGGEKIDIEGCPKLYVKNVADAESVIELFPEYGKGVYTFIGTVAGVTAGFITTSKNNPLDADACSKAVRFIKSCDAFNIPLVTFVDTPGFALTADVSMVREIARLASAYAEATTAKISVITGRAFGAAYVALGARNANADVTLAWPNAQISALCPDTAVEFLWADKLKGAGADAKSAHDKLVAEYIDTEASPFKAAEGGFIEAVIAPDDTRRTVIHMLDMLAGKRETKLPKKHVTL